MGSEIAILEPRRSAIVTPEMRARAARQIEEYRARREASESTASTVAAAVGGAVDSALGKIVGYATSFVGEAEIEHRAADGSTTRARLKFDYRR
jgi:hypothetical protein